MQQFDPRQPALRLAPRMTAVAIGGILLVGLGWRLSAGGSGLSPLPTVAPEAIAALQHQAFAQAETAPGFAHAESVPVKIQPGETFTSAVQRAGVTAAEAQAAVGLLAQAMDVVNIKAGLAFDAAVAHPQGEKGPAKLIGLSLRTGPATAITLSRTFDGVMRLRELAEPVKDETTVARGELTGSLYESAAKAGATPTITAQVVKLFSHKLDFTRDIQPGDQFRMVFDRKVTDTGRTVETGDLLYAEIAAKGGVNRFYRFDRPNGDSDFFDELGKNIKGFLLKTPVDGARISSTFGARKHPILGFVRGHKGVDFAAGTGTPILAAGDGVVLQAGRNGGYGNWVRIKHDANWDTGYGHISRFAAGIRPGVRVRQGQVIAYVGSTGLATGPHLHYETFFHGTQVNPLSINAPQGSALGGADLIAFKAQKAKIDGMLAQNGGAPAADAKAIGETPQTPKLADAELDHARGSIRSSLKR